MDETKKIAKNLSDRISDFEANDSVAEVGMVVEVKDGVAKLRGLTACGSQEMLEFENGIQGLAFNLESDSVGAIILGDYSKIKQGDLAKRTHKVMSVPVGEQMIGRVINSLGEVIDGGTELHLKEFRPIEKIAPGVIAREPVNQPLQTGIKAIDALIPVGRGQRELILGDRQTGKTAIAIDTIINQKGQDVICVYVAIGQKESKVARIVTKLKEVGAMDYTIVVSASASEPAPMLYLSPYTGVTLAEFFADQGKDVLVVYDDLSKHAWAYREMSLLLRRPPGREAYPGDVFYLHSRLLERACNLNKDFGGGSITALPIIETQAGDISAYVPTNVISITDGQIFLESNLFYKGVRPAVNVGLSVSRVGGAAQIKGMKKVAGSLKLAQAQYRELEAFVQFSSDLDAETKSKIERGKRLTELLKQGQFMPQSVEDQVISIFAMNSGIYDDFEVEEVKKIEEELLSFVKSLAGEVIEQITKGNWTDEMQEQLTKLFKQFVDNKKK